MGLYEGICVAIARRVPTQGGKGFAIMLDYDQLEAALKASPAPRVTKEQIEARITGTEFTRLPDSGAKP